MGEPKSPAPKPDSSNPLPERSPASNVFYQDLLPVNVEIREIATEPDWSGFLGVKVCDNPNGTIRVLRCNPVPSLREGVFWRKRASHV